MTIQATQPFDETILLQAYVFSTWGDPIKEEQLPVSAEESPLQTVANNYAGFIKDGASVLIYPVGGTPMNGELITSYNFDESVLGTAEYIQESIVVDPRS